MSREQQKRWNNLRIGDVIQAPSGKMRIVRNISRPLSRGKGPNSRGVTLTIQRCSWTGRPDTAYPIHELQSLGYRVLAVHVKLNSKFDRLLAQDIGIVDGKYPDTNMLNFKCCDVIGIP